MNFDWNCDPQTGAISVTNETAMVTKVKPKDARLEAHVDPPIVVDAHRNWVRFTGLGSWKEWSLWGAAGGGLAAGGGAAATVVAGTGGTAVLAGPVGWTIVGVAGAGGAVVGALTFRDEKTATFDLKFEVSCVCDANRVWTEQGPRTVEENINDSTGDLVWRNNTWTRE